MSVQSISSVERAALKRELIKQQREMYASKLAQMNGKQQEPKEEAEPVWTVPAEAFRPESFDPDWLLAPTLMAFVKTYAAYAHWPAEFLAAPLLAVCGACIGTSRMLEIDDMWHEFPLLWSCVIAEPGSGKTPALKQVMGPYFAIQGEMHAKWKDEQDDYEDELRRWENLSKNDRGPRPQPPRQEKVLVSDITIESLVNILEHNPRGVLLERDELIGWIGSFNQYRKNGGADRQHWLSIWSGKDFTVDRKAENYSAFVRTPFVAVTGSIQPKVLRQVQDGAEDGLVDRLVLFWPECEMRKLDRTRIDGTAKADYGRLLRVLRTLDYAIADDGQRMPRRLQFSDQAYEEFAKRDWRVKEMRQDADLPLALRNALAKMSSHAARIAIVLHCCRLADGAEFAPNIVGEQTTIAAWNIVDCSISHLRAVFAAASVKPSDERAERAIAWIVRHGRSATVRELVRGHVVGITKASQASELIQDLADRHLGVISKEQISGGEQIKITIPDAQK